MCAPGALGQERNKTHGIMQRGVRLVLFVLWFAPSPRPGTSPLLHARACLSVRRTITMPDKSDLSHLLLMKLWELSLHGRAFSMVPSDKRIQIAGHSANQIEVCFAQLVEEGFMRTGSEVDGDGNLIFTGLSTTGRDFVGAIRNQELPK